MKTVIVDIFYPYVYTKSGQRELISNIKGNPVVGATVEINGNQWQIVGIGEIDCEVWTK